MSVKGIDVARYEPIIDWYKVQQAGYKFTFIKVSQSDYNDPRFSQHWYNARRDGMPRGGYHFYDPRYVEPKKQAEKFFDSLDGDLGELPFVIDIERFTSGRYHGSKYWYDYLERLNYLSGNHPVLIYTAYYYWNGNVYKQPSVNDVQYFANYDLWVANYDVSQPLVPALWPTWKFWQYSEKEMIDGIYDELGRITRCDADIFNGTEQDFQNYLLGEPTPMPTQDYMELTPTVSNEYRSVRNQVPYPQTPHIFGATSPTQRIFAGNNAKALPTDFYEYTQDISVNINGTLYKANVGDRWWKVYEANGGPMVGWVAEIHLGTRYLNTRLVSVTQPTTHTVEVYVDGVLEYKKEF